MAIGDNNNIVYPKNDALPFNNKTVKFVFDNVLLKARSEKNENKEDNKKIDKPSSEETQQDKDIGSLKDGFESFRDGLEIEDFQKSFKDYFTSDKVEPEFEATYPVGANGSENQRTTGNYLAVFLSSDKAMEAIEGSQEKTLTLDLVKHFAKLDVNDDGADWKGIDNKSERKAIKEAAQGLLGKGDKSNQEVFGGFIQALAEHGGRHCMSVDEMKAYVKNPEDIKIPAMIGDTPLLIRGATPEQAKQITEIVQKMYDSDEHFRDGIDSKSETGLTIDLTESEKVKERGAYAYAYMNGDDMYLNIDGIKGKSHLAAVIAHEFGHNIDMPHGDELDDFTMNAFIHSMEDTQMDDKEYDNALNFITARVVDGTDTSKRTTLYMKGEIADMYKKMVISELDKIVYNEDGSETGKMPSEKDLEKIHDKVKKDILDRIGNFKQEADVFKGYLKRHGGDDTFWELTENAYKEWKI